MTPSGRSSVSAFTGKWRPRVLVLISDITVWTPELLANATARSSHPCKAIWDTGATGSVITAAVAAALSLTPTSISQVHTANGVRDSYVYLVDIQLPNGVLVQNVRVTEGTITDADALIGMDIIGLGDFIVTNFNGGTTMSFRVPSVREVDYTTEPPDYTPPMNRSARRQKPPPSTWRSGKRR